MSKTNIFLLRLIIAVIVISPFSVMAQTDADKLPEIIMLGKMTSSINEAVKNLPAKDDGLLAQMTLAKIDATIQFLQTDPENKNIRAMVDACWLSTELTILRINTEINQVKLQELKDKKNAVLKEIDITFVKITNVHEEINRLEKVHIARFRQDLLNERLKNEHRFEQAKSRFSELENKFIQVNNQANQTIISMSDLLFGFDKYDLTQNLKISLARIAGILGVFKGLQIKVEGHTDDQGTLEYNQDLSERRAQNVLDYMIEQGIDPERLTAEGYNFSRPVAPNDTDKNMQRNRRVDLVIHEKKPPK